jgi:hypothetical protein
LIIFVPSEHFAGYLFTELKKLINMVIGELRPFLGEIARSLRILVKQSCSETSALAPIAATSVVADPTTIPAGYTHLVVTKTNGSGTVTITFPDSSTYVLSASAEVFSITGNTLGSFTIALGSGATYKYYAY